MASLESSEHLPDDRYWKDEGHKPEVKKEGAEINLAPVTVSLMADAVGRDYIKSAH